MIGRSGRSWQGLEGASVAAAQVGEQILPDLSDQLDRLAAEQARLVQGPDEPELGQGRDQTVQFLKANPKLGEELIARLKEKAEKAILQPA